MRFLLDFKERFDQESLVEYSLNEYKSLRNVGSGRGESPLQWPAVAGGFLRLTPECTHLGTVTQIVFASSSTLGVDETANLE